MESVQYLHGNAINQESSVEYQVINVAVPNLETSIFKEILIVCFWSSPHEIDDRKPFPYLFVYVSHALNLNLELQIMLLQIIIKLKVWKKM